MSGHVRLHCGYFTVYNSCVARANNYTVDSATIPSLTEGPPPFLGRPIGGARNFLEQPAQLEASNGTDYGTGLPIESKTGERTEPAKTSSGAHQDR